jgi:hypothetical protein
MTTHDDAVQALPDASRFLAEHITDTGGQARGRSA